MERVRWQDVEDVPITSFPYKGKPYPVKGISVRWLSRFGNDGTGSPEYGLRLFTAQPGGEIPIHNHFYIQSMYILSGCFECWRFDPETDQPTMTVVAQAGDTVVVPSMEPHGMRNLSATEPATFLCCICNVYEKDAL